MTTISPFHIRDRVKCGLNQPKSSAICKKRGLASVSTEQAESGQRTVTMAPVFIRDGRVV
jgi:hypothetical protein